MAYTMAMKRDVANTIGSENMRKGRMRATDRVFDKFCFFDIRGVRLADCPTQVLAARSRRACSTGPYVSIRLSEVIHRGRETCTYPEEIVEEQMIPRLTLGQPNTSASN